MRAEAWSDCQQLRIEFDATLWAEQATDQALIDLGQCGCRGDYPADDVVIFMADHDAKAASLFKFLDVVRFQPWSGETNGFECAVDENDFREWLQKNKPHIAKDLYSRLDLKDFEVCYLEEPGDDMDWTFECQAEDKAHAKEQCEDAYPGCVVLHVSPVDSEVKP